MYEPTIGAHTGPEHPGLDHTELDPTAATIAAYEADAHRYRDETAGPAFVGEALTDAFVRALPPSPRVLEIGSGPGWGALELERRGVQVDRSDITPAFVELMRADGHDARVLDPLHDDLGGPYAGVYASAVLLHVAREDLAEVLTRLRAAVREGGVLCLSLKEGDGEEWSTHGAIRAPRYFTYWREEPLRVVIEGAGWQVGSLERHVGRLGASWLDVIAHTSAGGVAIRRARPDEAEQIAELFCRVRAESVPAIPPSVHPREEIGGYVRDVLMARSEVWVAQAQSGLVGYESLTPPGELKDLYIAAPWTRRGLGARFVGLAKARFPEGLELWAFQSNTDALRFYERHGFVSVEWTDGDNEEGAPDVRMVWSG